MICEEKDGKLVITLDPDTDYKEFKAKGDKPPRVGLYGTAAGIRFRDGVVQSVQVMAFYN